MNPTAQSSARLDDAPSVTAELCPALEGVTASRSVTVDRDMSRPSELSAFADRIARDAEFSASVLSVVALHHPELLGVTVALLGNGAQRQSTPPPSGQAQQGDAQLGTITDALLAGITLGAVLVRVTLAVPPGAPVRPLVDSLSPETSGGWCIVEQSQSTGAEHVHGLVMAESLDDARRLLDALAACEGLHPSAVCAEPVRGQRAAARGQVSALRRSIWHIAQYDLALGAHVGKRARELPIAVVTWGSFAGADESTRLALSRPADIAAPTVTPALLCACGCSTPVTLGRIYLDDRHAARARQRRARSRKHTNVSQTVTPELAVTLAEVCLADRDARLTTVANPSPKPGALLMAAARRDTQ
jgi:hypothetical protein